jgi:heterotetrameric sarcosine oxidase delta subunit
MRDETEFRYGGNAGIMRPSSSEPEVWARYLYWQKNPVGLSVERWLHVSGCRRWFVINRDLRTNTIVFDGDRPRPTDAK